MENRKEPKDKRAGQRPEGKTDGLAGKDFSEGSPNPHGVNKILEMPIRTRQNTETGGKNIPQVPNTIGGNLNPSVAHDFQNRVVSERNAPEKRNREPKPIKEIKRKDA